MTKAITAVGLDAHKVSIKLALLLPGETKPIEWELPNEKAAVRRMIKACKIRHYSIYLHRLNPRQYYLFSYFEYTGRDFAADMAKMAADPTTQEWWRLCKPCQKPVYYRGKTEWWAAMEEVFHLD